MTDQGTVKMEFIWPQTGAITFQGVDRRREYRGGNNDLERYAEVDPADVAHLESTGAWRTVPIPVVSGSADDAQKQPQAPQVTVGRPRNAFYDAGYQAFLRTKNMRQAFADVCAQYPEKAAEMKFANFERAVYDRLNPTSGGKRVRKKARKRTGKSQRTGK
jgi:hypothetical protein